MNKYLFGLILILCSFACNKEELFDDNADIHLWLFHEGAEMPVVVEGNTNSKVFLILLHGGPGSSAQTFNTFLTPFSDPLEEDFAMVYWDQRNSGLSRGDWNESKLTLDQHIEDLDQVIELLKFKFGNDIIIFLSGHSWGGYLSQIYLLDQERQNKVRAWIDIDGLLNRNQNLKDALAKVKDVCEQRIAANSTNQLAWSTLLEDTQSEIDKNTLNYDEISEDLPFNLIKRAELLISGDGLLDSKIGSGFQATYQNNSHPPILAPNDRTLPFLVPMMFEKDNFIINNLINIEIPSLFLYGFYDVRTPVAQGEYCFENISTPEEDKKIVTFQRSGHSSLNNQPAEITAEIKLWIEKYK